MIPTEVGEFKKLFPQDYILIILSSLFQAGSTLQKKHYGDHEDSITRRLHKKLIRTDPFHEGPLDIHLQPEIPSFDPDDDSIGGRIDMLVSTTLGYQIYFAIEAKRLRVCSKDGKVTFYGSYEYVNDGMMRFAHGQYAPLVQASAMLGYVYDGKIEKARSGINKSIKTKALDLKILSPAQLILSKILPSIPIDETQHIFDKNRQFTIYHILLRV